MAVEPAPKSLHQALWLSGVASPLAAPNSVSACGGQDVRRVGEQAQLNGIRAMVSTAGLCLSTVTFSHSSAAVEPSTVILVKFETGAATP